MANNNLTVQGCYVFSVKIKGDKITAILKGEKDTIRAGAGDIGDVIKSLELHSTAGESAPIMASLLCDEDDEDLRTYAHPFIVDSFVVKQDDIKISLEAKEAEAVLVDVAKSLAIHASAEQEKPVELVLSRPTV